MKVDEIERLKNCYIDISIIKQRLQLIDQHNILLDVQISSAKNGLGEQFGSECTPRGWHIIRAKIGENCPINTIFSARRPTGEIYSQQLHQDFPQRDWILTRILWLSGLEVGKNRLGQQDTMRRYIYIHGSPDCYPMGEANSHGCIRMHNYDLIELFSIVESGIPVFIH